MPDFIPIHGIHVWMGYGTLKLKFFRDTVTRFQSYGDLKFGGVFPHFSVSPSGKTTVGCRNVLESQESAKFKNVLSLVGLRFCMLPGQGKGVQCSLSMLHGKKWLRTSCASLMFYGSADFNGL